MASEPGASLFTQKLDRAVFVAYFLGAVVPLFGLAVVVEHFVLPATRDGQAGAALVVMVASMAVLSLGAFLVLRVMSRKAIGRMDRDNERLSSLLAVSRALSGAQHAKDAATTAARCALEVTSGRAAYVFLRDPLGTPVLTQSAGPNAEKHHERVAAPLLELVKLAIEHGRPAVQGAGRESTGDEVAGIGTVAVVPLVGEKSALGAIAVLGEPSGRGFSSEELDSLFTLAALASVSQHNAELRDAQRNFFSHVTELLNHAVDAHLDYHAGHGTRVAQLSNRLARELGLGEEQLERLHFGALLHDIGMLKLDRRVQHNARACAKHTVLGYRMLGRIKLWQRIAPIVHHHHEWWDGHGYPDGLSGEAIPIEARIIAVADAYDSMTSDTSYKVAIPSVEAVQELRDGAASQFDPGVVDAFVRLVERGAVPSDE